MTPNLMDIAVVLDNAIRRVLTKIVRQFQGKKGVDYGVKLTRYQTKKQG
jgi:hypothetical protein